MGNASYNTGHIFEEHDLQDKDFTPTVISTGMILINQKSANKFWARSPKDNFLKKSTCLIVAETSVKHEHAMLVPTIGCCFSTDKYFANLTIFEKGYRRNISVKLFQNLTSGFREDGGKMLALYRSTW